MEVLTGSAITAVAEIDIVVIYHLINEFMNLFKLFMFYVIMKDSYEFVKHIYRRIRYK